jgi:hypothetical protein
VLFFLFRIVESKKIIQILKLFFSIVFHNTNRVFSDIANSIILMQSNKLLEQIVGVAMTCTIILTPFIINVTNLLSTKFWKNENHCDILSILHKIAFVLFAFVFSIYDEIQGSVDDTYVTMFFVIFV